MEQEMIWEKYIDWVTNDAIYEYDGDVIFDLSNMMLPENGSIEILKGDRVKIQGFYIDGNFMPLNLDVPIKEHGHLSIKVECSRSGIPIASNFQICIYSLKDPKYYRERTTFPR